MIKFRIIHTLALAVLLMASTGTLNVQHAHAATVDSFTPTTFDGSILSSQDLQVYILFTLDFGTAITSLEWRGIYTSAPPPLVDDFTLSFFEDTGASGIAALGALISDRNVGNAVNRFSTGTVFDQIFAVFDYTTSFAALNLEAGDYWLTLASPTFPGEASFSWLNAFADERRLVSTTLGSPFLGDSTLGQYFILGGEPLAVIPLPAALPLYGTGLAVMGFLGWRRKRQALRD